MKANESYRRVLVLLKIALLRKIALTLTFISLVTSLTNQLKATEQCVPVVLFVIIVYKWFKPLLCESKNCEHFELVSYQFV